MKKQKSGKLNKFLKPSHLQNLQGACDGCDARQIESPVFPTSGCCCQVQLVMINSRVMAMVIILVATKYFHLLLQLPPGSVLNTHNCIVSTGMNKILTMILININSRYYCNQINQN